MDDSHGRSSLAGVDGTAAQRDHSPNSSSTLHTNQQQQQQQVEPDWQHSQAGQQAMSSMAPVAPSTVRQLRAPSAVLLLEKVLQKQTHVLVGVANYLLTACLLFCRDTSTHAFLPSTCMNLCTQYIIQLPPTAFSSWQTSICMGGGPQN
jgi:hypothetical protein